MTKQHIRIIADNKIPFLKGALEPYAEIGYKAGKEITNEMLKDADALITRTRTLCNERLLAGTKIKFIATATIGFDHIDVDYCRKAGIRWTNAPGCNSASVMQYVASALLTVAREQSIDLTAKTLGVVGVGNVGTKVARLARLLGMNVLCNDPPRMRSEKNLDFVPFDEILRQSDIISFHVPLTKEGTDKTYHLADSAFFSQVNKNLILLNTSRGPVVETQAVKQAITSGKLSAAILDVWEKEPEIDRELLEMVTIGTPHIAGYSADGKANGTSVSVHAISDYFQLDVPKDWYPEIPLPENPVTMKIDCSGKTNLQILSEAILPTYTIRRDVEALKRSPETFEEQRGKYPIRREYPQYTIRITNPFETIVTVLRDLGFSVIPSTAK